MGNQEPNLLRFIATKLAGAVLQVAESFVANEIYVPICQHRHKMEYYRGYMQYQGCEAFDKVVDAQREWWKENGLEIPHPRKKT